MKVSTSYSFIGIFISLLNLSISLEACQYFHLFTNFTATPQPLEEILVSCRFVM